GSAWTHPRTPGPRTTPATISSTGPGTRSHGARPSSKGTPNATSATTNRLTNPTSGMTTPETSESVGLEQVQPDLADRREGRDGVPQLLQRHPSRDRDRGGVQQLLSVRAGERRTHD